MPISNLELEEMELKYLDRISEILTNNLTDILENLRTRIKTLDEWYPIFRETARPNYRASDLERGAERVIGHYLTEFNWKPVSAPIGSDFMYETDECLFNIEIKTSLAMNPSDYRGLVPLLKNQTSYPAYEDFDPKLPQYYNKGRKEEKPCLTYAIHIINVDAKTILRESLDYDPVSVNIISIPNGQLYQIYGKKIVKAGKTRDSTGKRTSFRYNFSGDPLFRVIKEERGKIKKRFRIIWLNDNYMGITIDGIKINYRKLFGLPEKTLDF